MIQILLAVIAGLVTVAAPCILPLLPILLGVSIGHTSKTRPLFIVAGFVLVFSIAAVLISFLVAHAGLSSGLIRNIGIAVLAVFGLLMVWPALFDKLGARLSGFSMRIGGQAGTDTCNRGGFILGMTLGLVWTPCAGPVLASILALIALQRELTMAAILLFAYSIGAAAPMLIIAYAGQYLTTRIEKIARYSRLLQQIFGILIILLAIAIYFNYDVLLYSKLLSFSAYCSARL